MFRSLQIYVSAFVLMASVTLHGQGCSVWNTGSSDSITDMVDGTGHIVPNGHGVLGYYQHSCTYSGAPNAPCTVCPARQGLIRRKQGRSSNQARLVAPFSNTASPC